MPGNPLLDSNNLSDVSDPITARENLEVDSKEQGQARVDELKNELAGPGGSILIGAASDINSLRSIEPTMNGQRMQLIAYNNDWEGTTQGPLGGGEFYFDALDSSSSDDGAIIIVTPTGKRWKRKLKGFVTPQMFGAKGNGKIISGVISGEDDSNAFFAMLSFLVKRSVNTGGSNPSLTLSAKVDSDSGFFRIDQPRKFIGDVSGAVRSLGLKYFSHSKAIIYFNNDIDGAELIYNNDKFLFLRFYNIRFVGNNLGSVCHSSYSAGGAQDCLYFDCDFDGKWKSLLIIRGTNNNSEFKWDSCAITGDYEVVWDFSGSDQFLNYWAHKCKFWLYSGSHLVAQNGGHFKFFDCDWSGLGTHATSNYTLFDLQGASHARGMCDFRIINGRFEIRSIYIKVLNCLWNYGNIELSIDMSSQASAALLPLEMFTFSRGNTFSPRIKIRDSQLVGVINFKNDVNAYLNPPASAKIEGCTFWYIDNLDETLQFTPNGTNYGGGWQVDVDGCSTSNSQINSGVLTHHIIDGLYGQPQSRLGGSIAKLRYATMNGIDGRWPKAGSSIFMQLPVGSILKNVTLQVYLIKSDSTSYSYNLLDGQGNVISTIAGSLDSDNLVEENLLLKITAENRTFQLKDNLNRTANSTFGICLLGYL